MKWEELVPDGYICRLTEDRAIYVHYLSFTPYWQWVTMENGKIIKDCGHGNLFETAQAAMDHAELMNCDTKTS